MCQREICQEFGISWHFVQVAQKKHVGVGYKIDFRPSKLDQRSKKANEVINIQTKWMKDVLLLKF